MKKYLIAIYRSLQAGLALFAMVVLYPYFWYSKNKGDLINPDLEHHARSTIGMFDNPELIRFFILPE